MNAETYYSLLEVGELASQAEIRAAYLRLAREYHPDSLPAEVRVRRIGKDAEERFKRFAQAYEILSDPGQRRLYDADLRSQRAQTAAASWARAVPERPTTPPPSAPRAPPTRTPAPRAPSRFAVSLSGGASMLVGALLAAIVVFWFLSRWRPAALAPSPQPPVVAAGDQPPRRPIRSSPPAPPPPPVKLEQLRWRKLEPSWGSDSPEIATLRVDPSTRAPRLLMRHPTAMHLPRHWHTRDETNRILKGTYIFESDGKRDTLGPGSSISFPARTIHQAWAPEGGMFLVTVEGWDINWVDGPPQRPPTR